MEANFLTPGQKIKRLRVNLEMSQQDLEDKNITRAYISMIETEKRSLNSEIVAVLLKKFKEKAKILNVNIDIDEQYLLNTPCQDAEKYCNSKLENTTAEEELTELLALATNYNLYEVKIKIYNNLANLNYQARDFSKAFVNYESAVDMCYKSNKTNDIAFLLNRIGLCMLNQNMISESIYYFDKAKCMAAENNDLDIQKNAMYNLALCYNRLDMLDKSSIYINNLIKIDDGLDLQILKALIYEKQNNIKLAIEFYEDLVEDEKYVDDPLLAVVYNNLGILYLKENNLNKSLENFNKSQILRELSNHLNLSHTLIEKAIVYKKQNNLEDTLNCIITGRKLAEKHNDIEYLIKSYYIQIKIYEELQDNDNLLKIQLELYNVLEKTEKIIDKVKICNRIINLYSQKNDIKKIREFTNISLDLLENTNINI